MDEKLQTTLDVLAERFGAQLQDYGAETYLIIDSGQLVEVCWTLHEEFNFDMLSDLTVVDYWPTQDPRFHVVYHLYSIPSGMRIGLRVPVPGIEPTVPTLESVYYNANWHEREIWDMFGIHIEGHSDLRRILMPFDWEGHPLRKDYPLGYEEVQFTFNFDEIDKRKPYAKE
jgi:NADH-quinone oxidoreductase subunit C